MAEKSTHEVELNLFYLHFRDAVKFHELAANETSKLKSFYARHTILSAVFASEALINRIYDKFHAVSFDFEKLSTQDKWLLAPLVCGKGTPTGKTYDKSKEPFQTFCELIKIRHWLVHPKPGNFVPVQKTPWTITVMEKNEEVPWIETQKGGVWSHTRIPKNPFELNEEHAQKAINNLQEMINELLSFFNGLFDKDWIWRMDLKPLGDGEYEKVGIESLWGGYTPKEDKNETCE